MTELLDTTPQADLPREDRRPLDLDLATELVVAHGLDAHRPTVLAVAQAGAHLTPAAAAVLADPTEPEVARLRAFAVSVGELRGNHGGALITWF